MTEEPRQVSLEWQGIEQAPLLAVNKIFFVRNNTTGECVFFLGHYTPPIVSEDDLDQLTTVPVQVLARLSVPSVTAIELYGLLKQLTADITAENIDGD